jgi:hypothetical protein
VQFRSILSGAFIAAAFALTGCGGGTPPSAPGSVAASALVRPQIPLPGAGSAGRLIYVTDSGTDTLYFYTYRRGKLKGSTSEGLSEPQGLCSEQNGNVFVANTGESDVFEYAHSTITPKQTLATPGEYPVGCAVDEKGDVAVSDIISTSDGNGNVEIFKGGTGSPISVTCPNLAKYYFLAYDKKGDLFVNGFATLSDGGAGLCEIPSGSTSGEAIALSSTLEFPGEVQWDGKYLVIADQDKATIGRFQIRGLRATLKGTVAFNGSTGVWFFLVSRDLALAFVSQGIGFFKYPAGGNAFKTLQLGSLSEAIGFAVSPTSVL